MPKESWRGLSSACANCFPGTGIAKIVPFDLINPENTIGAALGSLTQQSRLHAGSTVVVIGSIIVGEQILDAVQMRVV